MYVGAFHDYIQRELKYMSQETVLPVGAGAESGLGLQAPATGLRRRWWAWREQTAPDVAVDLADTIRKNPKLRVFSANGYFDLATPFFATEYDLSHMEFAGEAGG